MSNFDSYVSPQGVTLTTALLTEEIVHVAARGSL